MSSTVIIQTGAGQDQLAQDLADASSANKKIFLEKYVNACLEDVKSGKVKSYKGVTQASGTLTCATVAVDDTCKIGSVTLTAKAAPANENQFSQAGSDTADAASLASVINAHSVLSKLVSATSALGVVTITALASVPGALGNAIRLAGTAVTLAASGEVLSGGTQGSLTEFDLDAVS